MAASPPIEDFLAEITTRLEPVLAARGGVGQTSRLGEAKAVADDTLKYLVRDRTGRPSAVILWSSPVEPGLVKQSVDRAQAARHALSDRLGQVVLTPLLSGEYGGLTYVVWPYCQPLSRYRLRRLLQRWQLRPQVLEWLREATRSTLAVPGPGGCREYFQLPLERMEANLAMPPAMRAAACKALARLSTGQWTPKYVLAHNDFWSDNLLVSPEADAGPFGFVVIDWAGANLKGHAIYDLIRIAQSLKLFRRQLSAELERHCRILDCSVADSEGYLLASLGFLGMNLGHFPEKMFIALAKGCHRTLREACRPFV